jgi:hypothetical protein
MQIASTKIILHILKRTDGLRCFDGRNTTLSGALYPSICAISSFLVNWRGIQLVHFLHILLPTEKPIQDILGLPDTEIERLQKDKIIGGDRYVWA